MKKLIFAVIIVALATTSAYAQKKSIKQQNYEDFREALDKKLRSDQKQLPINQEKITKMSDKSPIKTYSSNRSNLISSEMQKKTILFSDEVCMRSGRISDIHVEKDDLNQSSLIIKIEFEKVQTINRGNVEKKKSDLEESRYITIRDRSLKSYGSIYGFKLMNTTSCYDEEVYIKIEDKEMEKWFKTLLEGFSGELFTERFDSEN
jgi:hypothetical protein